MQEKRETSFLTVNAVTSEVTLWNAAPPRVEKSDFTLWNAALEPKVEKSEVTLWNAAPPRVEKSEDGECAKAGLRVEKSEVVLPKDVGVRVEASEDDFTFWKHGFSPKPEVLGNSDVSRAPKGRGTMVEQSEPRRLDCTGLASDVVGPKDSLVSKALHVTFCGSRH